MIRGPICSLNASTSISTRLPEDDGTLSVQEVARVATRIGHAQFHDGCPWTIDLMSLGAPMFSPVRVEHIMLSSFWSVPVICINIRASFWFGQPSGE